MGAACLMSQRWEGSENKLFYTGWITASRLHTNFVLYVLFCLSLLNPNWRWSIGHVTKRHSWSYSSSNSCEADRNTETVLAISTMFCWHHFGKWIWNFCWDVRWSKKMQMFELFHDSCISTWSIQIYVTIAFWVPDSLVQIRPFTYIALSLPALLLL